MSALPRHGGSYLVTMIHFLDASNVPEFGGEILWLIVSVIIKYLVMLGIAVELLAGP